MKNFVDLKNYLIKEIKPQENYQYFIFKELLNSGGKISYDELAERYDAENENTSKTDIKTLLKDAPTKVLTKHGYITADKNNVYANFNEEPLYYKETISWILEKCLEHWAKNNSVKELEFKEGIIKTHKEIESFCYESNIPTDLVEKIILSINRGEKQIILDGPPGTGKTYLIKKIIQFLSGENSIFDLVQFHPSYGYEEFVEGLRPTTKDTSLSFEVVPGKLLDLLSNRKSQYPINKKIKSSSQKNIDLSSASKSNFYFVAQGGSYQIAKDGNNIWAPNKNARGSEQVDWSLLKKLKIGDIIIHYSTNHIRALGRVKDLPKENVQRPYSDKDIKNRENTTYLSWENKDDTLGTLVEVDYFELKQPINKNDFCGVQTIDENKLTKNSAFDKNGKVSQKYLSILSSNFIDFLKTNFHEFDELIERTFEYSEMDILHGFSSPEVLTSLNINEIPERPGVHLIYYSDSLLYVGETGNTRRRIAEHMRSHHASGDTFINHSQKKFDLDLTKDEDKSKFDQLRSNMTIIYKFTEEKEALKNRLINELKPEYNKKLAPVDISESNDDTSISRRGEIILQALKNLGGKGGLSDIYKQVNLIDEDFPEASIRRDLQKYSHGLGYSEKNFPKIFRNTSSGVWEIVDSADFNTPIEKDFLQNKLETFESFGSHDFLIIDEINRGNLPKIFGELLNAFEYRDENISLQYSDKPLSVPSNLIFLGTMNSTDKSVGRMDSALRRRFDFIHVEPNYEVLEKYYENKELFVPNLTEGLKILNDLLEKDLGKHCLIGHTFFMKNHDSPFTYKDIQKIWERKIYPLLEEYFLDDSTKLEKYKTYKYFWEVVEEEKNNKNSSKKYSKDLLSEHLKEISNEHRELQLIVEKWGEGIKNMKIRPGDIKTDFRSGGRTLIYTASDNGLSERDRKYQLFKIAGNGKIVIPLESLYSENFIRAPFDNKEFREVFESKLTEYFQKNNLKINTEAIFSRSRPSFDMQKVIDSNSLGEFLNIWDWVIEEINNSGDKYE